MDIIKRIRLGNMDSLPQDKRNVYLGDLNKVIDSVNTLWEQYLTNPLQRNGIVSLEDFTIFTPANKTVVLDQVVWRDEYPAHILEAGAQAAPEPVNVTIGGVFRRLYSFDGGNTEERLSGSFEIPHDMILFEVTDMEAILPELHLHFRPSTNNAGTVKFFFDWEHSPAQGAPDAQDTISMTFEIPANSLGVHFVKTFGYLPNLGYEVGDKIGFNLRRSPADAADTYASDILFEQIALHVPIDTLGSRTIYTK